MSTAGPSTVRPSHHALSSHSIFIPPAALPNEDEWEIVDNPAGPSIPHKCQRVVMRDKDLIVAFGSEIRITSLAGREWKLEDGKVGSYSVLKSAHLDFEIQQLCLNPTGRLLAVAGRGQISVLVLPRTTQGGTGAPIQCRSFVIDEHLYTFSSLSVITRVAWHPWGESGQSLWILTSDGKLREYDLRQPEDPIQTFSFLPTPISSPSRSRLTAIDPLSQYATSFAFYPANHDFGSSMVYVLAANGDIYVMGPILPLRTELPVEGLQRMKLQFNAIGGHGRDWMEELTKQSQNGRTANGSPSPSVGTMLREGSADALLGSTQDEPAPGCIRLRPPHLTISGGPASGHHRPLLRQGPVVFSPGPAAVDEEDDDIASDLAWLTTGDSTGPVLILTWSGGRVDVGVSQGSLTPQWLSSREPTTETSSLAIIESVKLDIPHIAETIPPLQTPSIFVDPLEPLHALVQYTYSLYSLRLQSRQHPGSLRADTDSIIDEVSRLSSSSSPFIGSVSFADILLGYTALAATASGRALAIEMDLDPNAVHGSPPPVARTIEEDQVQQSLLSRSLDYGQLIQSTHPKTDTRGTTRSTFDGRLVSTISPSELQQIGKVIACLRQQARALHAASEALESRFDLCIREAHRQFQLIKNCRHDLDALRDSKAFPRAVRLMDTQLVLARRLEALLELIMATHRNGNQAEDKRWANEVREVELEVGDAESGGLNGRMNSLRERISKIKADLAAAKDMPDSDTGPEHAEVNTLETGVKDRSEEIRKLMRRMEGLNLRLDAAAEGRS